MEANSIDKRDTRDPEQIGKALKELKKSGMTICQAADYLYNNGVNIPFNLTNGKAA